MSPVACREVDAVLLASSHVVVVVSISLRCRFTSSLGVEAAQRFSLVFLHMSLTSNFILSASLDTRSYLITRVLHELQMASVVSLNLRPTNPSSTTAYSALLLDLYPWNRRCLLFLAGRNSWPQSKHGSSTKVTLLGFCEDACAIIMVEFRFTRPQNRTVAVKNCDWLYYVSVRQFSCISGRFLLNSRPEAYSDWHVKQSMNISFCFKRRCVVGFWLLYLQGTEWKENTLLLLIHSRS